MREDEGEYDTKTYPNDSNPLDAVRKAGWHVLGILWRHG
jgi:hypothetical protein